MSKNILQTQLLDALAVLSQPKESVSREQVLSAIDTLSRPDLTLTQELLLAVIAALANPKEQLDDLVAVVNEMFAAIIRISSETEILKLDQVSRFISWVQDRLEVNKPGIAVGEAGVGKTCACKFCVKEFEPIQQQANQLPKMPVLYIAIDEKKRTPVQFLQLILIQLKKPTSGTLNQLKQRVKKFLRQYKVEVILIDEAHDLHFDTLKTVRSFFDDDDLKIIPIVIGTSNRLDSLIEKDEQFRRRFRNTFVFEEFSGEEFKKVLKIWGDCFIQIRDPMNPDSGRRVPLLKSSKKGIDGNLAKVLEDMTSGDLGLLDQILKHAARQLLKNKIHSIYQKILKALKAEDRLLEINAKTILKNTKIDKSLIQSLRGSYFQGETSLS